MTAASSPGRRPHAPPRRATQGRAKRADPLDLRRPDRRPRADGRAVPVDGPRARSSPQAEFLRSPPTFLPRAPTTDNYSRLFDQLDFPRFFFNSAVVALAVTVGNLIFCPMLGYALAKLRWRGKRLVMGLVLATLMVPAGITLIPNFILMSNLGPGEHLPGPDPAVPRRAVRACS